MGATQSDLLRRRLAGVVIVAVVLITGVAVDQVVKQWAVTDLSGGRVIEVVPTVSLRLVFNPGVAFGLGSGLGPVVAVVLMAVLAALTGWIALKIWRGSQLVDVLLLSIVLAGGIGNVVDRVGRAPAGAPLTGEVVDYLAVSWFAIFNLADVFAVGGVLVWIVVVMLRSQRQDVAG